MTCPLFVWLISFSGKSLGILNIVTTFAAKRSTTNMNKTNKVSDAILYGSLLTFILFVVYILYINQEVFYTAHDRSEFIFGAPFFQALLSKPFGLIQYVGAWLTQFFYHPALGAGVLIAIWILIFFVGVKAFRLHGCTVLRTHCSSSRRRV